MAFSPSLNTFLILLLVSMAKAKDFTYCFDLIFTKVFYDTSDVKVKKDTTFASTDPAQLNSAVEPAFSCSSVHMNNFPWRFLINFTPCQGDKQTIGFWVNFESTISSEVMKIGNSDFNKNSYIAKSTTEGKLDFDYINQSGTTISNQVYFNVNKNSWIYLALNWGYGYLYVYMFGQNSKGFASMSLQFNNPGGAVVGFGYGIKGFLYEISWFNSITTDSPYTKIDIYDFSGTLKTLVGTCTVTCSDSWCHPTQKCLSLASDCISCDSTGCKACGTSKDPTTYCLTDCPANCARCSSSAVCTRCVSGYFLYDKSGVTSCVDCSTSCTTCSTSPNCFYCANLIAQDGSTCRVDSIGYQISFSAPNIELDFAHPLTSTLTKNSIGATLDNGTPIDTSSWALNSCVAGAVSCTITANNLSVSQLPLNMDLKFNQA